jgi:transposase
MGGHKPKTISGEHAAWLSQRIRADDFTLRGLVCRAWRARTEGRLPLGVGVCPCREAQLQKKSVVAGERDRPDVARRRVQWTKYQDRVEPERLVFIDETWTRTDMAPLRGWASRGHRLTAKVPHGRWRTMTFLAALRHDRIDAPWFIEGPIDGESFRTYVAKVLLPTLRPGDIVVLDNLGSHRGKAVRQLIRSVGAKLFFLPKYSPDLNPIEQVFAKLKHLVRKAAARTVDAVCAAIGEALQAFTPAECANYLKNSGYRT